jgi:hypothetical protein
MVFLLVIGAAEPFGGSTLRIMILAPEWKNAEKDT